MMASQEKFQLRISGTENPVKLILGVMNIGRQEDNEIVLENKLVSRHHATIEVNESDCLLTDLESANGTYLNGKKLTPMTPVPLQVGDQLQIGKFELDLEQKEDVQPVKRSIPEKAITPPQARKTKTRRHERMATSTPPPNPPSGSPENTWLQSPDPAQPPPGLSLQSRVLINYLPDIYQGEPNGFLSRYLAIFEAILLPIQWQIDNFDLFLDSFTAPTAFLPWLTGWFRINFDPGWSDDSRRLFLKEASQIYARLGTLWSLSRSLEIFTGSQPTIRDQDQPAFSFTVELPFVRGKFSHEIIEQLIKMNKPAFTTFAVIYKE